MEIPAQSGIANAIRGSLLLLVAFWLADGSYPLSADEPHSPIRNTVAELEQIRLPGSDPQVDLPYDVPEAARPLLTKLKHQLRDLILSRLNAAPGQAPDASRFTAELVETLRQEGVTVGKENVPKSQSYGGILDVKIEQPAGHPDLVAATTKLQIPCSFDGDTSLYVFQRTGSRWKIEIEAESNDYPQVKGAQDMFTYVISPGKVHGKWFVVTAYTPAWCTSCWGGVDYRVLQPGPTPDDPVELLAEEAGIYRCAEPPYKLVLEPGGFRLDYVTGNLLDFNLFTAVQVDRYAVTGDRVTRVAPIAYSPQDFANVWVTLPWKEAARWSNPAVAASLKRWHERLQPGSDYLPGGRINFVQACNKAESKWQIGLSGEFEKGKALFLTVTKKEDSFFLESIDTLRPPGCPGESPPVAHSGSLNLLQR